MNRVLAIDLGGSKLRAATADADHPGRLVSLGEWAAPPALHELARMVCDLKTKAGASGDLAAIGMTVPGLVDGTTCLWVPNLPYLDGADLAELLGPCANRLVAANDAQLALLAEVTFGAAQTSENVLLVAIGTGIGSAVLAAGRIIRGAHHHACSFGWACADLNDPGDSSLGWLERAASGLALDAAGAAMTPPKDGAGLISGARRGDAACITAVKRSGQALGAALAGAIALLDPSLVLLSGGVSEGADVLIPAIRDVLRRHLPSRLRDVRIERGALGARAGLVGAAIAAAKRGDWWDLKR
jgi:predicted NBD/HSP70 family sugar kinase